MQIVPFFYRFLIKKPKSTTESERPSQDLIASGQAFEDAGQFEAAECCYRQALESQSEISRAYLNLGNLLSRRGDLKAAENCYRQAAKDPGQRGAALANLGNLALQAKSFDEALKRYQTALPLVAPQMVGDLRCGIAACREGRGDLAGAIDDYRAVLTMNPEHPGANLNLGHLLMRTGQLDAAKVCLQHALSVWPNHAQAHCWLGKVLSDQGYVDDALVHLQQACILAPDDAYIAGITTFTMSYSPKQSEDTIDAARRHFAKNFCPCQDAQTAWFAGLHDLDRPLTIGYLSADFREHPIARFIETVFVHHDCSQFILHAFSNHAQIDATTERLKSHVLYWHQVESLNDDALIKLARASGIDILIELNGLTEGHRLPALARRLAPIQATWLGYLGSTGLAAMDYRLCDRFTDPPGLTEAWHTERLARLPHSQWCYTAAPNLPPVGPLPLLDHGYLRFGSFNNVAKLSDAVLAVWSRLLSALPEARLVVGAAPEGGARTRILEHLHAAGVAAQRVSFLPRLSYLDYFSAIGSVDIALDSFPYQGGTTTLDTLIMGVPVLTMAGSRTCARSGVSLLENAGLSECVATEVDDLVETAMQLSQNPERLAAIRQTLRSRLQASPLMSGASFTRDLEAELRTWWRTWCDGQLHG